MDSQSVEEKVNQFFSFFNIPPEQIELVDKDLLEINITPSEEERGMFIGRYGTALDSFQLILSLIVNAGAAEPRKIVLDVGGYRQKRFEKLQGMVDELCEVVEKTHKPKSIANLSPTERRFIHLYLAENDKFTSFSQGEGESRRLFIALKD